MNTYSQPHFAGYIDANGKFARGWVRSMFSEGGSFVCWEPCSAPELPGPANQSTATSPTLSEPPGPGNRVSELVASLYLSSDQADREQFVSTIGQLFGDLDKRLSVLEARNRG